MDINKIKVSELEREDNFDNSWLFGYKMDVEGLPRSVRFSLDKILNSTASKYDGEDILISNTYQLSGGQKMYVGDITQDETLAETDIVSCYGSLYMFIRNQTDGDKTLTFPTPSNYYFFQKNENVITVPKDGYVEVLITGYGEIRVVSYKVSGNSEPLLVPDPFVKGKTDVRRWEMRATGYNNNFQDTRDWSSDEIERTDYVRGNYPIQEIDEYWFSSKSLMTDYRWRQANDTWLNWAGYSDKQIEYWSSIYLKDGKSIDNESLIKNYGSPMYVTEGIWAWLSAYYVKNKAWSIYKKDNIGNWVEEKDVSWKTLDLEDIYQLIGQAPRESGNFYTDIINFIGANAWEDDTPLSLPYDNNKNVSGFNLYSLGAKGLGYFGEGGDKPPLKSPIEDSYIDDVSEEFNGFGQYGALHVGGAYDWDTTGIVPQNNHKRILFISGNAFTQSRLIRIDGGYPGAVQSAQVRFCRKKSDEELGYKMYINEAKDEVTMVDYPLSAADASKVSGLSELPKGLERGIALRYTNREHRKVLRKWSEIKAEAADIMSQIIIG